MGTITSTSLVTKASTLLTDVTNVRWSQADLLAWLNDGQREIVALKPNAYIRNISVLLAAGTKQQLPTDGITLIDVVRNMGTDGATAGKSIRAISREVLDNFQRDWHLSTRSNGVVQNFVYNRDDPLRFYVYPPQPAAPTYVEIAYGAVPADTTLGNPITLDDVYATALLNYICYRGWTTDAEYAGNMELANSYYTHFIGLVTGKEAAEGKTDPNAALGAMSPDKSGSQK